MKSKRQISLISREWKIFKVVRAGNKNYQPRKCVLKTDSNSKPDKSSPALFFSFFFFRSIYKTFSSQCILDMLVCCAVLCYVLLCFAWLGSLALPLPLLVYTLEHESKGKKSLYNSASALSYTLKSVTRE